MLRFVKKHYDNYVSNHKAIPTEMKVSLRRHPKMRKFIRNMAIELQMVQELQLKGGRRALKKETLKGAVEDMTELFIKGFKGHADRRIESDLAKSMQKEKVDNLDDMQSALEGNSKGVYEDMGLEIPEDQQEKPMV